MSGFKLQNSIMSSRKNNCSFAIFNLSYLYTKDLEHILNMHNGSYINNRFKEMYDCLLEELINTLDTPNDINEEILEFFNSRRDNVKKALIKELTKVANNSYNYAISLPKNRKNKATNNGNCMLVFTTVYVKEHPRDTDILLVGWKVDTYGVSTDAEECRHFKLKTIGEIGGLLQ